MVVPTAGQRGSCVSLIELMPLRRKGKWETGQVKQKWSCQVRKREKSPESHAGLLFAECKQASSKNKSRQQMAPILIGVLIYRYLKSNCHVWCDSKDLLLMLFQLFRFNLSRCWMREKWAIRSTLWISAEHLRNERRLQRLHEPRKTVTAQTAQYLKGLSGCANLQGARADPCPPLKSCCSWQQNCTVKQLGKVAQCGEDISQIPVTPSICGTRCGYHVSAGNTEEHHNVRQVV